MKLQGHTITSYRLLDYKQTYSFEFENIDYIVYHKYMSGGKVFIVIRGGSQDLHTIPVVFEIAKRGKSIGIHFYNSFVCDVSKVDILDLMRFCFES